MKKILMILACMVTLCAVSFAGWEHLNGRTYWISGPTSASCFIRDNSTTDVYIAPKPLVYFDTIRLSSTNSTGEFKPSYGFFDVDEDGDYIPLSDITIADATNGLQKLPGWRVDVEWLVDNEGDLVLKP